MKTYYYVYMVRCSDGSLYTGYTDNLYRRMAAHNCGEGAKYTRSRRPTVLVYASRCESKSEAMSKEWHIKRLSRAEKMSMLK